MLLMCSRIFPRDVIMYDPTTNDDNAGDGYSDSNDDNYDDNNDDDDDNDDDGDIFF